MARLSVSNDREVKIKLGAKIDGTRRDVVDHVQNGTSPLKLPLFPLQLNVGTGTGMGTLTPSCPGSTVCVKYRAADPDEV